MSLTLRFSRIAWILIRSTKSASMLRVKGLRLPISTFIRTQLHNVKPKMHTSSLLLHARRLSFEVGILWPRAKPRALHAAKGKVTWQESRFLFIYVGGGSSMPVSQKMGRSPNLKNKILKFWGKSAFVSFVSTSPQVTEER